MSLEKVSKTYVCKLLPEEMSLSTYARESGAVCLCSLIVRIRSKILPSSSTLSPFSFIYLFFKIP